MAERGTSFYRRMERPPCSHTPHYPHTTTYLHGSLGRSGCEGNAVRAVHARCSSYALLPEKNSGLKDEQIRRSTTCSIIRDTIMSKNHTSRKRGAWTPCKADIEAFNNGALTANARRIERAVDDAFAAHRVYLRARNAYRTKLAELYARILPGGGRSPGPRGGWFAETQTRNAPMPLFRK